MKPTFEQDDGFRKKGQFQGDRQNSDFVQKRQDENPESYRDSNSSRSFGHGEERGGGHGQGRGRGYGQERGRGYGQQRGRGFGHDRRGGFGQDRGGGFGHDRRGGFGQDRGGFGHDRGGGFGQDRGGGFGQEHGGGYGKERGAGGDKRLGKVSDEMMTYFRRVSEALSSEFDDEETKLIFLNNVFEEMGTRSFQMAQNQTISRTLEACLRACSTPSLLFRFAELLWPHLKEACEDRFASHVLQTWLQVSAVFILKGEDGVGLDQKLVEFCDLLLKNWSKYLTHMYASHLLRVLAEVMSGTVVDRSLIESKLTRKFKKETIILKDSVVPAHWNEKCSLICSSLERDHDITKHVANTLSSPVLQTIFAAFHRTHPTQVESIIHSIFDSLLKRNSLKHIIIDRVGSHFLQRIIEYCREDDFVQFQQFIEQNVTELIQHAIANFVVQSLILHCPNKATFGGLFECIAACFPLVKASRHFGIFLKLCEGCIKHQTKQKAMIEALATLYDYTRDQSTPGSFMKSVLAMEWEGSSEEDKVTYHGSLVVQKLFTFKHHKLPVREFVALESEELARIGNDAFGCHVVEAFVTSSTINDANKKALYDKLKGFYVDLACSRYGSRSIDALWAQGNPECRSVIAEDIAANEDRLKGNQFGKFLLGKMEMHRFKRKPDEWKKAQQSKPQTWKLFEDIIDPSKRGEGKKKKKKRKHSEDPME